MNTWNIVVNHGYRKEKIKVSGERYGNFGIREDIDEGPATWKVDHIPTGALVACTYNEGYAQGLIEFLNTWDVDWSIKNYAKLKHDLSRYYPEMYNLVKRGLVYLTEDEKIKWREYLKDKTLEAVQLETKN